MADIMTLKDLAEYLRMNERTIAKLVQDGKIPGFKVASQWRFSREAIDAWFADQMRRSEAPAGDVETPRVSSLLSAETVSLNLRSRTKDGVLAEMAEMMTAGGRVSDAEELLAALRERERLCSTGIGRGIAFLHPRNVIPGIVKEPVLGFGRAEEPVEFDSVDGKGVRIFFLDCAPGVRTHLAILARLSRLLADDELLKRIVACETPEAVIEAVRKAEERIVGN